MKTIEEACLIAALDEDGDELRRLLGRLLPGERGALSGACRRIREAIQFEKRAPIQAAAGLLEGKDDL